MYRVAVLSESPWGIDSRPKRSMGLAASDLDEEGGGSCLGGGKLVCLLSYFPLRARRCRALFFLRRGRHFLCYWYTPASLAGEVCSEMVRDGA